MHRTAALNRHIEVAGKYFHRKWVSICAGSLGIALNTCLLAFLEILHTTFHLALAIVAVFNILLIALYVWVRREFILPAIHILTESTKLNSLFSRASNTSLRSSALEFTCLIDTAVNIAQDRDKLLSDLHSAQTRIQHLMQTQQGMCYQTLSESLHLFTTVDAYAAYLEELVAAELIRDGVREDYDEVTEASQNLRFLIQGMTYVVQIETHLKALKHQHTDISMLLGRLLMQITPILERRAMKINSARCLETLPYMGDETILAHTLCALLTTCMHYAENDTTLHVEGYSHATATELRFFVTVSSPNSLSIQEREAFMKAMESGDDAVHMFHHTMMQYPNMQLAERLASVLGGSVACVTDGDYCCKLSLTLPHHRLA